MEAEEVDAEKEKKMKTRGERTYVQGEEGEGAQPPMTAGYPLVCCLCML